MSGRTWLVTGASGLLGHALCAHLASAGDRVVGLCRTHQVDVAGVRSLTIDLCDDGAVEDAVHAVRPDVVVHAAGLTDVDLCEREEDLARRIHVDATRAVASAAAAVGAGMVHISTDHLWDGTRPLVAEDEPPRPLNAYARTKLAGEVAALDAHARALVLRTNFFGRGRPWRRSFSDWIADSLVSGQTLKMFSDVWFTPIALDHLCPCLVRFVDGGASGVYHLAGGERLSKADFGLRLARRLGFGPERIDRASIDSVSLAARRPHDMSLSTAKAANFLGHPLPDADTGIATLAPPSSP